MTDTDKIDKLLSIPHGRGLVHMFFNGNMDCASAESVRKLFDKVIAASETKGVTMREDGYYYIFTEHGIWDVAWWSSTFKHWRQGNEEIELHTNAVIGEQVNDPSEIEKDGDNGAELKAKDKTIENLRILIDQALESKADKYHSFDYDSELTKP